MIDDIRPSKPKVEPVHKAPIETTEPIPHTHHETFKTPEEVAATDTATPHKVPHYDDTVELDHPAPKNSGRWAALKAWRPTKKQGIIIAVVAVVLIGGVAFALTRPHHKTPAASVKAATKPKPKPVQLVSTLTGLPISDVSINQRPVTGVMIENSDDARPQSGLDQAGVVFEAIAEAGITRFLALYQDTQPTYLGPVRSARPYYLQWCLGFDCAYAHVGGSPDALADIPSWGVRDLNQFYNASGYERVSNRAAPHNVYTSAAQLSSIEAKHNFNSSTYTGWPRKADSPSKTPNASNISVNPSSADFASSYIYDAGANDYKRSEAGKPHMVVDGSGHQTQITPKVVIVLVMSQSNGALDSSGAYYTEYASTGSGAAYIFQDGTVATGTWTKTDKNSQITFTNASNQPIKLNAGQSWVTVVGSASKLSYK